MKIAFYRDEVSQDSDLVRALRLREVDVMSSAEAGMNGSEDQQQLTFAAAQGRVLYSFNSRDFFQLHSVSITEGKMHAGIVLAPQRQFSIGEQARRLLKLIGAKVAEEMRNQVEFLGAWGADSN